MFQTMHVPSTSFETWETLSEWLSHYFVWGKVSQLLTEQPTARQVNTTWEVWSGALIVHCHAVPIRNPVFVCSFIPKISHFYFFFLCFLMQK